jgi:hypothetical protein
MATNMKTFYLGLGHSQLLSDLKKEPQRKKYFVIGVKYSSSDVDELPSEILVEKLGEVVNPKYIYLAGEDEELNEETYNEHILQPAFVSLKEK